MLVKKLNKNCSTKHCLTLISCCLNSELVSSKQVTVSATFQIMQTFRLYSGVEFNSRIINHIVCTTKKCFSPDSRDMVESIVANPTVIWIAEQKLCRLCRWFSEEGIVYFILLDRSFRSYSIIWLKCTWIYHARSSGYQCKCLVLGNFTDIVHLQNMQAMFWKQLVQIIKGRCWNHLLHYV